MSDDLFAALEALRSDPALADVFSRPSAAASTTATDHRNSSATHRSPSKADRHVLFGTDPGSSPQSSRSYATAINRGSGAESASLDFLRHRAEQREELGVAHWLTRHRQEVTEADQRRMENRLRAEHLFATAQLAAESFRDASTLGEEHAAEAAWTAPPLEKQSAAGSSSSAQYPRRANTPPQRSSPSPPPPQERSSITSRLIPNAANAHGAASSGLPSVERSDAATAELRRSPPPPPPEVLNEEANYAAKVRALALPAPQQAYPAHRSTPPPAGSSLFGQRSPSPGQTAMSRWLIDSAEGTAASASRTRLDRSERADRNVHSDTIHLLRKAVTDRDEQIVRLERRLREQQQHFDASIQDARREHDAALRHADQRAALLETEISELTKMIATTNMEATRDAHAALTEAHATFTQYCETLRDEMASILKGHQIAMDLRLHEVIEAADLTNRSCRETYIVEKAEVITHEKEALLQRLAREQDLMLREAEVSLQDSLERQMLSKLRADVRHYVTEAADSLLIPKLKSVLGTDVETYFGRTVRTLVDAALNDGARRMREELAVELTKNRDELSTLSSTLAAETMASTAQLVESAEIERYRQMFEDLKASAERRADEHRSEVGQQAEHTQRMTERIRDLEEQLQGEKVIAQKLAAEVVTARAAMTKSVLQ
jgi:hypothetical protein